MIRNLINLWRARNYEGLNDDQARKLQSRLLKLMLQRAVVEVPFYRDLYRKAGVDVSKIASIDDIVCLPVVDRDAYRALSEEDRVSSEVPRTEMLLNATSGSTGKPLRTFESYDDLRYLRSVFINDLLSAGLRPWHRGVYLRAGAFARHPLEKLGIMRFSQVRPNAPLVEQVESFLKINPNFVYGYYGSLFMIARALEARGLHCFPLKGMLLGGESMSLENRSRLERFFRCKITDYYGSTECFTIARSCAEGKMHLRRSELLIEVQAEDGSTSIEEGTGDILITRLVGRAMPLVRYRIGDTVKITRTRCACGSSSPVVSEIRGRSNDLIVDKDGGIHHAYGIKSVVDYIEGIDQVQFIQEEPGRLRVLIVPQKEKVGQIGLLLDRLQATMPQIQFVPQVVNEIARESSGKIKLMKSSLSLDL